MGIYREIRVFAAAICAECSRNLLERQMFSPTVFEKMGIRLGMATIVGKDACAADHRTA
jgi:hypothetical protein